MNSNRPWLAALGLGLVVAFGFAVEKREERAADLAIREAAFRANNLGVALLEQYRFADGVEQLRLALSRQPGFTLAQINLAIALFYLPDLPAARKEAEAAAALAPEAPQPQYMLGLIARQENRPEDAEKAFARVRALDANDVGARVNLGQVLLQQRRYAEAIPLLEGAVAAEPYNVTAAYNLGVALTRAGRREEGAKATERFQQLRESVYKTQFGQNYLEQGRYAEASASTGAEAELVDAGAPKVAFVEDVAAMPAASPLPAAPAPRIAALDADGDGALDVLVACSAGVRLLHNAGGRFKERTAGSGLDAARARAALAGDLDNDGRVDLVLLGPLAVFHNEGDGRFRDVTSTTRLPSDAATTVAALADLDHDGDLDLVLGAARPGEGTRLLRNNGDGRFTDVTEASRLGAPGVAVAFAPTDFDNRRDLDLLLARADGPPLLFKNLRDGSFRDVAEELGLAEATQLGSLAVADVNKDGYSDFFLGGREASRLAWSDAKGGFRLAPAPAGTAGARIAAFLDYDNDGLLDLLVGGDSGLRLLRNGGSAFAAAEALANPSGAVSDFLAFDVDQDGDVDLVTAGGDGALHLLRNEGGNRNRSIRVGLVGRVSNRTGIGAKVEMRAGSLKQKLETYATTPAVAPADLVFGLGARAGADVIRVLWTSGIVQTETELPASRSEGREAALAVTELDRKPSSCPYLYAWNGSHFEFVTDFLGGGEMGYWLAPGVHNEPDPEEYVRLTAEQLRAREGRYELRVTNELEEALFLDHLELLAVTHPAQLEVYPNEGMTHRPRRFRLFGLRDPRTPSAFEDDGREVTDRVARLDHRWPDGFRLRAERGYAEPHALVLDLGAIPADHTLLLLTGWTDYAFSSDNLAAHQHGSRLQAPSLEVEDAPGRWRTAVADVGIPVGRPQTIVLELAGTWRGAGRRARLVTNMRIYWDRIQAAVPAELPLRAERLRPLAAELRERGFSAAADAAGAREPWGFAYDRVSLGSPFKTMPGRYTRLGDVKEMLATTDDFFVVARPGDEVALAFDASRLAPLPAGFTRTFLLHGDGFSKEMDLNSASPDAVMPLPYHGMQAYPYRPGEVPAAVRARALRQERYNTRVVARSLAPLDAAATPTRAEAEPSGCAPGRRR